MWSYYGTKKKIAKYYPEPIYDKIIEPFAGAAQYSLYGDNWKKEVILLDKYQVITDLWKWLQVVTPKEIMDLPTLQEGDCLDDFNLSREEKYLIGFCINSGSSQPKKTAKKFNSWTRTQKYVAENLYKIKHWKIMEGDYNQLENEEATWFIDPPYFKGGIWYRHSNKQINYDELSKWCRSRKGQVIVCENSSATWLPFKPLVEMNGQLHKTMEVIWVK